MKNLFLILISLLVISCKKEELIDGTNYTVYSISEHKSTYDVEQIANHKIEGTAKFSSSCEYELTENIGQINKLIGLSVGINHHENSIRIGWEFDKGVFKLYAYWYLDGNRDQQYLISVDTDERFSFVVDITDTEFYIRINDVEFHKEHSLGELKNSYLLYPYFGGEAKFPGSLHGDKECKIYIHLSDK